MDDLEPSKISGTSKNLVSDNFHVADFGYNNWQYLIDKVTSLIEKRTGNKHYNLEQLWKEKGINLVITATDLTTQRPLYFCHKNYPRIPLRILVRVACSIPGIFNPVIMDGHYMVDGGLLDNLPLHIFDENCVNSATLGVMFRGDFSPDATPSEQGDISMKYNKPNNKIVSSDSFYTCLINCLVDKDVKNYIKIKHAKEQWKYKYNLLKIWWDDIG